MKAIQLLLNAALPEELRDYHRTYDAKSVGDLMSMVAKKYPEKYSDIAQLFGDTGRNAAWDLGTSIRLKDFHPVIDKDKAFADMDAEVERARQTSDTVDEFKKKRMAIWTKHSDKMEKDTAVNALAQGNNIANAVVSGARGKSPQLKGMVTTPGLYSDYKDNPIPIFVRHSFGEGLRPVEFMAGTFGARKSTIATKTATAKGGDFGKQLAVVATPLVVTEKDCGTANGIDLPIDRKDLNGRVLAKDVAGIPAGTILDRHALAVMRKKKVDSVIVRSAMTCQSHAGLCSKCLGADGRGKLPHVGFAAGISSAQAVSEPVTQASLNCLTEDTLVRMADLSVKSISTITPGEWVLGSDIKGATFPVKVTHVWDQGMQEVQEYTYSMGQTKNRVSVTCTKIHEILSNKKNAGYCFFPKNWTTYKLPAGYKHQNLAAVMPVTCDVPASKPEPWALLCGALLGDGIRWDNELDCATPRFSCADPILVEDLNQHVAQFGISLKKAKRSFDYTITAADSNVSTRNPLKVKLIEWEMAGKYAHEKRLPKDVLSWDNQSILNLIAGFVATDGSVGVTAGDTVFFSFPSTSWDLLNDIREVLRLRLCIYSSAITKTASAGKGSHTHDMWAFTVAREDQVLKLAEQLNIPGVKKSSHQEVLAKKGRPLRHAEFFYRAKRTAVVEKGIQHCWDLTVDHPDALFVLHNGLIVSNTKHQGGMVAGGKRVFSGFSVINQIAQSPEEFPDRAAVSEIDGHVTDITKAPQGGTIVHVGDKEHYVPVGYDLMVKKGDKVEAGDQLADGIVDPGDITRLRGLGEGRRFYADRLGQALTDSGLGNDPRNLEVLATAAINHTHVTDPDGIGDYLPDDTANYSHLAATYTPPKDTQTLHPSKAVGKYLQAPALHYTIGTKLTPKMVAHLHKVGMDELHVSDEAPGFEPEMVRLRTAPHSSQDWLSKMTGSYLGSNLNHSGVRGEDTNVEHNVHFAPRLAVGTFAGKGFGQDVERTGEF